MTVKYWTLFTDNKFHWQLSLRLDYWSTNDFPNVQNVENSIKLWVKKTHKYNTFRKYYINVWIFTKKDKVRENANLRRIWEFLWLSNSLVSPNVKSPSNIYIYIRVCVCVWFVMQDTAGEAGTNS